MKATKRITIKKPATPRPHYTIRLGTSYGYNDIGEYKSQAAAKRDIAMLRATAYPHACMKVVKLETA